MSLVTWLHPPCSTHRDSNSNTRLPLDSILCSNESTLAKRSTSSRLGIFITWQLILGSLIVLQEGDNGIMSFMKRKRTNFNFVLAYSAPWKQQQLENICNLSYSWGMINYNVDLMLHSFRITCWEFPDSLWWVEVIQWAHNSAPICERTTRSWANNYRNCEANENFRVSIYDIV